MIIGLPLSEVGECRKTIGRQDHCQRAFLSSFLQNIPKGWDSPASAMPSLQLFSTYRGSKQWGCHETLYWQQLLSNSLTSFNSKQKDLNVLINIYPLPKIHLLKLVMSHNICLLIVPISYHRQKRKLVYNQSISKADQKLGHKFVQWKWTCLLLTHLIQCSICKFGSAPQFLIDWLDLVRGGQPNRSESSSWSLVFTQKGDDWEFAKCREIAPIFLLHICKVYVGRNEGVFRVSRGVLIGVFRLGKDRGEVQVKHWERLILMLLKVTASLLSSPIPAECLNIVWSICWFADLLIWL